METDTEQDISHELQCRFPIVGQLLFSRDDSPVAEPLPLVVPLLASMTNPDLEGDTCVLLPSKERMGAYVATLVAFSAVIESFEKNLRIYAASGFHTGERVRVLPSGHVYEFGGYFEEFDGFFKLNVIDSKSGESRSFPVGEIVRLEKTDRKRPKGKGGTQLGEYQPSGLDYLIGTCTGGNDAFLGNEVLLVTKQSHFIDYMDHVLVARHDSPSMKIPLRDVIPWGVVTPEGDIDFRESGASTGEPLIAVSSRMEYVAEACKRKVIGAPRVVVDGVSGVGNSLQAFDDLVDYSKLLVLADHSQADILPELADRNCSIWKFPDNLAPLVGSQPGLLKEFRRAYRNASRFKLDVRSLESPDIDRIATKLIEAEKLLNQADAGEDALKLIGVAYARLLDLASLLHEDQSDFQAVESSVVNSQQNLKALRAWTDPDAYAQLDESFELIKECLTGSLSDYRIAKQIALLDLLRELSGSSCHGSEAIIVAETPLSLASVKKFLRKESLSLKVCSSRELGDVSDISALVLTCWPRIRNLGRIINGYLAQEVYALAYGFESDWYHRSHRRRQRDISRWNADTNQFRRLSGLNSSLGEKQQSPVSQVEADGLEQLIGFERRVASVRKGSGSRSGDEELREARYISFAGSTYAWLTPGYKVPVVTSLIHGGGVGRSVPLRSAEELEPGDYVLFRIQAGRDIIRFIAERLVGPDKYARMRRKAESWKTVLSSISDDASIVDQKLRLKGFNKTPLTMSNWLTDTELIGPGAKEDLRMIALAAEDHSLEESVDAVWQAIANIRAAHTSAGFRLSKILASQLTAHLGELEGEETFVDLKLDDHPIGSVVIVQVDTVADAIEQAPVSDINRILWDN